MTITSIATIAGLSMRYVVPFALLLTLAAAPSASAQNSAADIVVRLEQIEQQMRVLTGQLEQLQYRNQQLEQQLQRAQSGQPAPQQQSQMQQPPQQQISSAPQSMQPRNLPPVASSAPVSADPSPIRPLPGGRRGDAFDPNANPNAPGAPRAIGSLPAGQPSAPEAQIVAQEPVGARGGRNPGEPMDITSAQGRPAGGDQMAAVAPPGNTPRDAYDLGAGYIQRKDYALADQTFREFLRRYPNDRLAADAQFWLGESQFQRQQYREAADSFLGVSTKFETAAKAPDSLLRLGQSLAALGEKETACATFAEVGRKYPRAGVNVKQGVEREQKRVKC